MWTQQQGPFPLMTLTLGGPLPILAHPPHSCRTTWQLTPGMLHVSHSFWGSHIGVGAEPPQRVSTE